jgi:hypothetical protein
MLANVARFTARAKPQIFSLHSCRCAVVLHFFEELELLPLKRLTKTLNQKARAMLNFATPKIARSNAGVKR